MNLLGHSTAGGAHTAQAPDIQGTGAAHPDPSIVQTPSQPLQTVFTLPLVNAKPTPPTWLSDWLTLVPIHPPMLPVQLLPVVSVHVSYLLRDPLYHCIGGALTD